MNLRKMLVLPILLSFVFAGPAKAQASVTDEVKKVVDQVVSILSNKVLKKPENETKRQNQLKSAIGSIFDYSEMAQRAMGKYWKERTPAEKKEFVPLFESVLQKAYARKIESYNNEKVIYLGETTDANYAEVKSKVVTSKGEEFSINYRLINKEGKWVVYDVVIEGVSLVSNYRGQFDKIIKEKGYDELVKRLKSKGEEAFTPVKGKVGAKSRKGQGS